MSHCAGPCSFRASTDRVPARQSVLRLSVDLLLELLGDRRSALSHEVTTSERSARFGWWEL